MTKFLIQKIISLLMSFLGKTQEQWEWVLLMKTGSKCLKNSKNKLNILYSSLQFEKEYWLYKIILAKILSTMKINSIKTFNSQEDTKGPYEPLLNDYTEAVQRVSAQVWRLKVNRNAMIIKTRTES